MFSHPRRVASLFASSLLALLAAPSLHARDVMRFVPPSDAANAGVATVTLRDDNGPHTVVQGLALSDGAVRVELELNASATLLTAIVDALDASGSVVTTTSYSVAWPTDRADVSLSWADGEGLTDTASSSLVHSIGDELVHSIGDEFDIQVDQAASDRELLVSMPSAGSVVVKAYHPSTGLISIVSASGLAAGDEVTCSYDAATETITVTSPAFATVQQTIESGSTVSVAHVPSSGLRLTASYVAR